MNKHQPDHDRQHDNDNVIAFPVDRRVRPAEATDDDRYHIEVNGRWWSKSEWEGYEAHLANSYWGDGQVHTL
ncbi:hypothetical protein JQK15_13435 [Sphingobium sp. BHU LFT2]|uniref:hypothetical protein n=1 Tax=Sphingobium sp. BHU LFT2 TaxID=2807634 RepID=UPI001BE9FE81|nr:hypothetical protein [Sphingobium sp. BHU LFT2]MBT2244541.1 hypothetical protein [Sphingobium sp. BHU LFT2]